uniref:Uncharacterized protein n=1 Tax=Glossina pallidipes TaxID=7398 RepID=A0A1A9Z5U7_GLOPL
MCKLGVCYVPVKSGVVSPTFDVRTVSDGLLVDSIVAALIELNNDAFLDNISITFTSSPIVPKEIKLSVKAFKRKSLVFALLNSAIAFSRIPFTKLIASDGICQSGFVKNLEGNEHVPKSLSLTARGTKLSCHLVRETPCDDVVKIKIFPIQGEDSEILYPVIGNKRIRHDITLKQAKVVGSLYEGTKH